MARNTFDTSIEGIKSVWGPLSTEVVAGCRRNLEELLEAPAKEDWLAALHKEGPANEELYRDPKRRLRTAGAHGICRAVSAAP